MTTNDIQDIIETLECASNSGGHVVLNLYQVRKTLEALTRMQVETGREFMQENEEAFKGLVEQPPAASPAVDVEALEPVIVLRDKLMNECPKEAGYHETDEYADLDHFVSEVYQLAKAIDVAALTQQGQTQTWQDISTAPKDGTLMLVNWGDSVRTAFHNGNFWHITGRAAPVPNGYITHWMPLPKPPKEQEEKDR